MYCFCGTKTLRKVTLPKPGYANVTIAGVEHGTEECYIQIYCEHCEDFHVISLARAEAHPVEQRRPGKGVPQL